MSNQPFFNALLSTIDKATHTVPDAGRREVLLALTNYVQNKKSAGQRTYLNFICTHNSRRSQLSQIWAQTAADYYGVDVRCFSGGVEVTAFNERAVAALQRAGFEVLQKNSGSNPLYEVSHSAGGRPISAFSKLFDDPANASPGFAAVMTCSDADENCPYIPGAEARLPVRYEDPKISDGTPQEAEIYDRRSLQIASEMFYVFSRVR